MSREIKLRAWNKEWSMMSMVDKIEFDNGVPVSVSVTIQASDYDHKGEWEDYEIGKDIILQQFTGLHDKNGKEIYEGDIVRSGKEYNYYTGLNSEIYGGRLYEIKNNGWRFYIEPHSLYDIDFKDLEVIGNIYENKELLKQLNI